MDPSWDMANMFGENVGWVNVGESYGLYNKNCARFIPSGYDSHGHGKIHLFLIGKPSIYFYGPSIPWLC